MTQEQQGTPRCRAEVQARFLSPWGGALHSAKFRASARTRWQRGLLQLKLEESVAGDRNNSTGTFFHATPRFARQDVAHWTPVSADEKLVSNRSDDSEARRRGPFVDPLGCWRDSAQRATSKPPLSAAGHGRSPPPGFPGAFRMSIRRLRPAKHQSRAPQFSRRDSSCLG